MNSKISIEIVFALPDVQYFEIMTMKNGSTLKNAIELSKLNIFFPNINFIKENFFGIFGKRCELNYLLSCGDRIEIYRPLIRNAKKIRNRIKK